MENFVDESSLSAKISEFHDTYRTVLLNRKYYGYRLHTYRKWNQILDTLVAVGTSAAIAAWAVWKSDLGGVVWAVITGIATVGAVTKPALQVSKQIENYTTMFVGLADLLHDMDSIRIDINTKRTFDDEMANKYTHSLNRLREFAPYEEPKPKKKILDRCYYEVEKEIPRIRFWFPGIQGDLA